MQLKLSFDFLVVNELFFVYFVILVFGFNCRFYFFGSVYIDVSDVNILVIDDMVVFFII